MIPVEGSRTTRCVVDPSGRMCVVVVVRAWVMAAVYIVVLEVFVAE